MTEVQTDCICRDSSNRLMIFVVAVLWVNFSTAIINIYSSTRDPCLEPAILSEYISIICQLNSKNLQTHKIFVLFIHVAL